MSKFTVCISTICTTFKGFPKAVALPPKIMNTQQLIVIDGNVSYANHKPSERRIYCDFQSLGEYADFAELLVTVIKQSGNIEL